MHARISFKKWSKLHWSQLQLFSNLSQERTSIHSTTQQPTFQFDH